MPVGPFLDHSEQAVRTAVEVNFYGVLTGCRLVLPEMVRRRSGHIVNIASLAGMLVEVRYGPAESLLKALHKTWDTSVFSLRMLGKMITGEVSLRNLSGPITIADYAGQSAQSGAASGASGRARGRPSPDQATQTVLGLVNARTPAGPSSRPRPSATR